MEKEESISKVQSEKCKVQNLGQTGLTLVEILIAMGIATVAGVLLLVIIVNSAGLFSQQSSKVQEGLNINDALSQVRGSIKQASIISDQSGSNQLVLKILSLDSAGNIIENTYDDFIFMVDQKNLHFKTIPDPLSSRKTGDRILANNVDNLKLQYFNSATPPLEVAPTSATKVRITLILKQNIATSEASLRND